MLFLASLLIYPYFVDITNIYNWIWFIFIFALTIVICYFCCDITWKDAILAASCGALLQHTASFFIRELFVNCQESATGDYTYVFILSVLV